MIVIFRDSPLGRERVLQKDIDFWCEECEFSFAKDRKRCRSKALIQRCWNAKDANEWHRRHECPFIYQGRECRCNDYPNIKEAFEGAGLHKGLFK